MRVAVIGSEGMLGQEFVKLGCLSIPRSLDILDPSELKSYRAGVFINCAGIVKGRPLSDEQYMMVNGLAPHRLAHVCDTMGARLIQISTDCVFSGNNGPYDETDDPDAHDIYGVSKAAGEVTYYPHLTVRTSFIGWSPTGRGLLAWLCGQRGQVPGWERVMWNGLTAPEAARRILSLATHNGEPWGVRHMGGMPISKADLLRRLVSALDLDVVVMPLLSPKKNMELRSHHEMWLPTLVLSDQIAELVATRPVAVAS